MSETDYRNELEKLYPLDGVGTRFEHYNELRELFADGIEILTTMHTAHKSAADVIKLNELKAAEKMIIRRLEVLSGWERKTVYSGTLPSAVREIEINRLKEKLLLKGNVDGNPTSSPKDSAASSDIT